MGLFTNSFQDVQKRILLFFSLIFLSSLGIFGLWILFLPNASHLALSFAPTHLSNESRPGSILGGALFLRASSYTPQLPDLSREMTVTWVLDRPDRKGAKRGEVFLLRSGEKKRVEFSERIFFFFGENDLLQFSKEPSLFWMEMQIAGKEKVECRAGIGEEGKWRGLPLITTFQMPMAEERASQEKSEGVCFQKIAKAKWLGEDFRSFYQQKSGGEKKKEHRLEMDATSLLVSEGDWLSFQEQSWKKISQNEPTENDPLGVVGMIKEQQMEIEVFDETGHRENVLLNRQAPPLFKTNPDEWIVSVRERGKASISLGLEKQHFLFHKGSWAARKEGRWRVVKGIALQRIAAEAFFFFEGMEEREGQKWMKGVFFNGNGVVKCPVEKKFVSKKKRVLGAKTLIREELTKKEEKKSTTPP